jgi:hypothetical protein
MGVKWLGKESDTGHIDYLSIRALVVSGRCYTEGTETERE